MGIFSDEEVNEAELLISSEPEEVRNKFLEGFIEAFREVKKDIDGNIDMRVANVYLKSPATPLELGIALGYVSTAFKFYARFILKSPEHARAFAFTITQAKKILTLMRTEGYMLYGKYSSEFIQKLELYIDGILKRWRAEIGSYDLTGDELSNYKIFLSSL